MSRDNKRELRRVEELHEAIDRARRAVTPRTIIAARYPGRCYLCDEPIAIGDSVAWRAGTSAVHASCHRAATTSEEART